jgi:hypothetical protein
MLRFVRRAETGHVHRESAGELADSGHESRPVSNRSRIAMHENHSLIGFQSA